LLALHRARSLLVKQRTATINSVRGLLGEFGRVAAKGIRRLVELRHAVDEADTDVLPEQARAAITVLFEHLDAFTEKLGRVEREILAWHKTSEESQRLATAPGVGPLTATALVAAVGDGGQFQSARHFAAWLGLTPRMTASGSKERIGRISRGGDRYLRTLLIHGARAMLGTTFRRNAAPRPWLQSLVARRPMNVATVAVAHKTARALWAMLRKGETYRRPFEAAA
jgi:transposase